MRNLIATIALTIAMLGGGSALAVEEPAHSVVVREGRFEVRAYPSLVAAETVVQGERDTAVNRAFRVLADYIFGANVPRERIAMTAPVTQTRRGGERIAMTAPVTQTAAEDAAGWTVRFFMPAGYTLATLPRPENPAVRLVEVPAQRVAVLRFSGLWTEASLRDRVSELRTRVSSAGLSLAPDAEPTFAFYDPPWTPFFMRRNEVMLPLAPT